MNVVSCDEPETVVTNYVHPDGSVTRKIEMRSSSESFGRSDLQVPFDSTWTIKDTIEISEKGDTSWVKMAEKLFNNVNEINLSYLADSGANKDISRKVEFETKFKWFNTEYRFSEIIDRKLPADYPVAGFLNEEERRYFYSPDYVKSAQEKGPDSLKYKSLSDSVDKKLESWVIKIFVSEWIGEFSKLTEEKGRVDLTGESLREREGELQEIVKNNIEEFDSLWSDGALLTELIGEYNALQYKTEADTAIEKVTNKVFFDFKDYSVRIAMPGKVTNTNGFIDSTEVLMWPVKSDYFLTEPYCMWAESKTPNSWAWIVSGLFLIFVFTGVILRTIKKG